MTGATLFASLIAAGIFTAALAALLLVMLLSKQGDASKLQQRLSGVAPMDSEFEQADAGPLLVMVAAIGRTIDRGLGEEAETLRLLYQAGWRSPRARAIYFACQAALPFAAVLLMVLAGVFDDDGRAAMKVLGVLVALILGLLGPRWLLRARAQARRSRIRAEVPMLIHVLVLLFDAGLSTRQAIASLVRDGSDVLPVLGPEFALMLRQLEGGGDTADILRNAAQQLDVSTFSNVLSVIRQAERYGGEIRDPLLEALAVMEENRSLELREKVNLMSGRMTVVMVLFFFPALLIFVAGPAFVSIITALGSVGK